MKCFYHLDLDGICSAAIVKQKYQECELIGINYGHVFPWDKISKGEEVLMVDFCLQPFENMERLNKICKLTWIDHHKTAIDNAKEYNFVCDGITEIGKAGCELTWEFFHEKEEMPKAVSYLGRFDVWDLQDPSTLFFQVGMKVFDNDPNDIKFWNNLFNNSLDAIIEKGKVIVEFQKKDYKRYCDSYAFETKLLDYRAIAVNRGGIGSQTFESVWNEGKYDVMLAFSRMNNKMWTVSVFSTKKDIDCGLIAKQFGGGGHVGAAGFNCENLPFRI